MLTTSAINVTHGCKGVVEGARFRANRMQEALGADVKAGIFSDFKAI